jgi:OFA family oxalate/formate antiporter-like MFS transporter
VQGAIVLLVALLLRAPRPGEVPPPAATTANATVQRSTRDYHPRETLRAPAFWLMYAIFVLVAMGGLMATAQLAVIATDLGVATVPISILGITMAALPFALSLDRVLNGVTRPFVGWVSDHIGRENTMFIAFGIEGIAILALIAAARVPVLFVAVTGLAFFAWGEIYSLFPAISADTFGTKYATANYGILYTAKGVAALLVPISSVIVAITGSWLLVFVLASAANFVAAALALFVLKPLIARPLQPAASPPAPSPG